VAHDGSTDPRGFFEGLGNRSEDGSLRGLLPEGARVAFHIEGPGGGNWQLDETPEAARLGPVDDAPKDCVIRCSASDFMAILCGHLGAKEAFLSGRLRIMGDVGLALRLQDLVAASDA
jgi:hypothetical protein